MCSNRCRLWNRAFEPIWPVHQAPAWHRVPTEALSLKSAARTVMRRIVVPTRQPRPSPFIQSQRADEAAATEAREWTVRPRCEMPTAKRPRTASYEPPTDDIAFCGRPQSIAEITQAVMKAKVDFSNGILEVEPARLAAEVQHLRSRKTAPAAPMKRRLDRNVRLEEVGTFGGSRLCTYAEVLPILKGATDKSGDRRVDLLSASVSESCAALKHMRRDPRCRITLQGAPNLSIVKDITEPESILEMARPEDSLANGKSPIKKMAQPTSSIPSHASPSALADSMVRLAPTPTAKAEPSPTKSAASPSSPFLETPSRTKLVQTPATTTPRITVSSELMLSPLKAPSTAPGPTRVFQVPDYDSSLSMTETVAESTNDISRPAAPTPSKWTMNDPRTPVQTSVISRSRLSFGPTLPLAPQSQTAKLTSSINFNPADINFGPISPSFSSTSWFSKPDDGVERPPNKSIRRKSEPLIRRTQKEVIRRRTASPKKLVFQDSPLLNTPTDIASPAPTRTPKSILKSPSRRFAEHTPEQSSAEPTLTMATPAISWGRWTGRESGDAVQTPKRGDVHSVHNVDMRQNPDIFRTPASSSKDMSPSVDRLAEIAEERCDGQAKVQVTQENGRLIVRIKLPEEYAFKFCNSTGADESRFTVTPSAISSSPRITFGGQSVPAADEEAMEYSPEYANTDDHTQVVAEFAASPLPRHVLETVQEETEVVSSRMSFPSATVDGMSTTIPHLDETLQEPVAEEQTSEPEGEDSSDSPLSELDHTPTVSDLEHTAGNDPQTPSKSPSKAAVEAISTPRNSFTPVNPDAIRSNNKKHAVPTPGEAATEQVAEKRETAEQPQRLLQYDDSPGRDYMRDFIKRSSRKRPSATEAGSPVAAPAKRVPLGVKSPNMESPNKSKRKAPGDKDPSPIKAEPAAKKARRANPLSPRKKVTLPASSAKTSADDDDDADEAEDVHGARRSTRLRSQGREATPAKSAIPTAIKLGARPGSGRGGLSGSNPVRSEQQGLSYQTRANTRKNKGNAEYPAQFLAKSQEERERQSPSSSEEASSESDGSNPSSRGKNVGWKTPLESHQVDNEAKPAAKRAKIKAPSGVARSKIATASNAATGTKQRSQAAKNLGMSHNGTPAKSRVTRSSARRA